MYSDVPLFFFPSAPLHVTLKMTFSTFFFFLSASAVYATHTNLAHWKYKM